MNRTGINYVHFHLVPQSLPSHDNSTALSKHDIFRVCLRESIVHFQAVNEYFTGRLNKHSHNLRERKLNLIIHLFGSYPTYADHRKRILKTVGVFHRNDHIKIHAG